MQKVYVELEKDIVERFRKIQEACPHHNVYIGGGALRDTFASNQNSSSSWLQRKPKDIDVFLVPKYRGIWTIPVQAVNGFFVNYHKGADLISDMEDRDVKSLTGIFDGKLSTYEWQLIEYSKPLTTEELVCDMDININQIMYDGNNDFICIASDAFVEGHKNKEITMLHTFAKDRMYSRMERMEKKFPTYKSTNKPKVSFGMKQKIRSGGSRSGTSNSVDCE